MTQASIFTEMLPCFIKIQISQILKLIFTGTPFRKYCSKGCFVRSRYAEEEKEAPLCVSDLFTDASVSNKDSRWSCTTGGLKVLKGQSMFSLFADIIFDQISRNLNFVELNRTNQNYQMLEVTYFA